MIDFDDTIIARKCLPIILIIDKSGKGSRLEKLDCLIKNLMEEFKHLTEISDYRVKVKIVDYFPVNKITEIEDMETFENKDTYFNDRISYGSLFTNLDTLLFNESLQSKIGCLCPVLILLSEGKSSDNYLNQLENLKNNKWFRNAMKIAITCGDYFNLKTLCDFTGNNELVLHSDDYKLIRKLFKYSDIDPEELDSTVSKETGNDDEGW